MSEFKKEIEKLFDDEINEFISEYCDSTNTNIEEFTRMSNLKNVDWVRKANLTLDKLIVETPKELARSRKDGWD